MEVDQESVDHVAQAEEKLEETKTKYNEVVEELMTIREEKKKLETEAKFKEVTEGLTDTQVEKLATLSEGISFE